MYGFALIPVTKFILLLVCMHTYLCVYECVPVYRMCTYGRFQLVFCCVFPDSLIRFYCLNSSYDTAFTVWCLPTFFDSAEHSAPQTVPQSRQVNFTPWTCQVCLCSCHLHSSWSRNDLLSLSSRQITSVLKSNSFLWSFLPVSSSGLNWQLFWKTFPLLHISSHIALLLST